MTGQKFVMVMMALFVGFGIGYVILNGSAAPSAAPTPAPNQNAPAARQNPGFTNAAPAAPRAVLPMFTSGLAVSRARPPTGSDMGGTPNPGPSAFAQAPTPAAPYWERMTQPDYGTAKNPALAGDPPLAHTAGAANPQTVSAEEMARRTANYTPYQRAQLRAGKPVGERLAAIEQDCGLQIWAQLQALTGSKNKIYYREDAIDALMKLTRFQFDQFEKSAMAARRDCIGLALEFDPEAATAWTNVHGKVD